MVGAVKDDSHLLELGLRTAQLSPQARGLALGVGEVRRHHRQMGLRRGGALVVRDEVKYPLVIRWLSVVAVVRDEVKYQE